MSAVGDARKRLAEKSTPTRVLTDFEREIEAAILARLEAKSDHNYQWPRWAAAHEAARAVGDLLANDSRTVAAEGMVAAMLAHDPSADDCDPAGLVCSNPHHLAAAIEARP